MFYVEFIFFLFCLKDFWFVCIVEEFKIWCFEFWINSEGNKCFLLLGDLFKDINFFVMNYYFFDV